MRSLAVSSVAILLAAVLPGCGATPAPSAVKTSGPAKPPVEDKSKAAETKTPTDAPEHRSAKRERPAAEQARVAQLFQVPQFTVANTNAGDSKREGVGQAPQIHLLGFSKMDGHHRALVEVKGEVVSIEQGDLIDGVEVVAIDDEGKTVSFQYSGQRWTPGLFEKVALPGVVVARANVTPAAEPPKTAATTVIKDEN